MNAISDICGPWMPVLVVMTTSGFSARRRRIPSTPVVEDVRGPEADDRLRRGELLRGDPAALAHRDDRHGREFRGQLLRVEIGFGVDDENGSRHGVRKALGERRAW
jgi:hypothetical protein